MGDGPTIRNFAKKAKNRNRAQEILCEVCCSTADESDDFDAVEADTALAVSYRSFSCKLLQWVMFRLRRYVDLYKWNLLVTDHCSDSQHHISEYDCPQVHCFSRCSLCVGLCCLEQQRLQESELRLSWRRRLQVQSWWLPLSK